MVPIEVPALRERVEDIRVLVEHFIFHFCRELGRTPVKLHPGALEMLLAYAWPGNVRELKNIVERVVLLEAEDEIRPEHLPAELSRGHARAGAPASAAGAFPAGVVRPLVEIERMAIEHALGVCGGNKTRAAQLLGISRQTLRTKLKEFSLGDDTEDSTEPS